MRATASKYIHDVSKVLKRGWEEKALEAKKV